MANTISFDNAASGKMDSAGTHSLNFTCAVGARLYVLTQNRTTAVTYNGVSLTKIINYVPQFLGGHLSDMNLWYLSNPASGSNTLDVTLTGAEFVAVVSYTTVKETGYEAYNANTANDGTNQIQVASLSSSVTTLTNNAWTVLFAQGSNNAPRDFQSGGYTLRTTFGDVATDSVAIYDSNGAITPAGSSTLVSTWTSGSGYESNIILSLPLDPQFIGQMIIL